MNSRLLLVSTLLLGLLLLNPASIFSQHQVKSQPKVAKAYIKNVPEWTKDMVIYEVNVRQYTKEGTFEAFSKHLPRLKELGVDIIWFMPIHPISKVKRKGGLGSYYSIADYQGINPEFGDKGDFKKLVDMIHDQDMKVMLDWVANHTGWDHQWITDHPEWYTQNDAGEIIDPTDPRTGKSWGWTDVADLNYDNKNLHIAMVQDMIYWVKEMDVDGFRCDVASEVPVEFWNMARREIDPIKECFWLAEAEKPELHDMAFDMAYAWEFHHILNELAKGEKTAADLDEYMAKEKKNFSSDTYMLRFITNHDENTWNGTIKERMGDAGDCLAVLTFVMPGMPLVYSGQEVGLNKRLEFFEKDQINWVEDHPKEAFYQSLIQLKKGNPALWNGEFGGRYERLRSSNDENVFAVSRVKGDNVVIGLFNFTNKEQKVKISEGITNDVMMDGISREKKGIRMDSEFTLPAFGYKVLVK